MTPHIGAEKGDFARTVLMPGDPLRAKFIAENFLESPRLVTSVRGIFGYTGCFEGVQVSVMASGMGCPSIGIYSHELYSFYDVQNIVRIGSAGALRADVPLRSLVIGMSAYTNSHFGEKFSLPGLIAPTADWTLLETMVDSCRELGVDYKVGSLFCSDTFYDDRNTGAWAKMGCLAVEMESAALYLTAADCGKRALAICTISDSLATGEALSAEERQTGFTDMMKAALETARRLG